MPINLHQTDRSLLNTTYVDDAGNVVYNVSTPRKLLKHRTTTITRAVGNGHDVTPRFEDVAQISWNTSLLRDDSCTIHLSSPVSASPSEKDADIDIDTKSFFRKQGWGMYGRNRVFTALDGREYRWVLGMFRSSLTTYSSSPSPSGANANTLIAKFHRRHLGFPGLSKSRKPYLEIREEQLGSIGTGTSGGQLQGMIDLIMVTFLYVEKVRKDRERKARESGD